ncbi:MAG: tetratricopeptide repeat-containing protein, partial [Candidatus Huberarchaeum crystalense]
MKKQIESYKNSLKIKKEIGDTKGESACYTNLGVAYDDLGDFGKAIEFHENSLKIKKEIG